MDPLSITASVIAVLQISNKIISICYDYASAVRGSSWELQSVTEEVQSLRNVLETLANIARKAESANAAEESRLPTLKLLCEPGVGPLSRCLLVLEALEAKLAPPSWGSPVGSKRRALIQALGWPLKEGYTKKTLENIARFKATLGLAVAADHA
jgi:Fungal N-terminal domain of STAND proteins